MRDYIPGGPYGVGLLALTIDETGNVYVTGHFWDVEAWAWGFEHDRCDIGGELHVFKRITTGGACGLRPKLRWAGDGNRCGDFAEYGFCLRSGTVLGFKRLPYQPWSGF